MSKSSSSVSFVSAHDEHSRRNYGLRHSKQKAKKDLCLPIVLLTSFISLTITLMLILTLSGNIMKNNCMEREAEKDEFRAFQTAATTSEKNDEIMFQAALSVLSCFITPGCFPGYKCHAGSPHKLRRGKKWEETSFCVEDLKKKRQEKNTCLVYSFGIYDDTEWEEKISNLFGCEVHAFDPTVDHENKNGVTFHKLGLEGEGTNMSATNGYEYGVIDPNRLLSLREIMKRLNHTGRTLDLLAMDCEGCEWGVLRQLACSGDSALVEQLMVELHFQKKLGLQSERDVLVAADAVNCLRRDGWGMVSMEESGCDPEDTNYTRGVEGIVKHEFFLLSVAMQRMHEKDQTSLYNTLLKPKSNVEGEEWYYDFGAIRNKYYREREEKFDDFPLYPEEGNLTMRFKDD